MEKPFKVAIHYDNDCGYVEYVPETKKIRVVLGNDQKRGEIEEYLAKEHVLRVAGQHLLDFSETRVKAADNVDNLQLVLTRIWEKTGVLVDWSRPVA
ncbi:MAG TPA: hypothetical protein PKA28_18995 [Methylomusa anaerophila]|uniref:Uncharacterized protein n=1 Tax=Methylomusa anaerophila TaxID=1930071 RepID=A0A348AIC4_9FIRM|nr:hypothetical protein [Methylomusa anaerophila]BBB90822.1 hypothetical protein MAMMFC1_01483 [Methylomusa anaerophila]HML90521.1 hypothetical protein [Methylomusa anaerophila]